MCKQIFQAYTASKHICQHSIAILVYSASAPTDATPCLPQKMAGAQRDLVGEFMAMKEKAELKRKVEKSTGDERGSSSHGKQLKATAKAQPPKSEPSAAMLQEQLDMAVHEDFACTVFFEISYAYQNACIEGTDLDTVKAVQMLTGAAFFQTRHVLNNSSVWKLCDPSTDMGVLYMFKAADEDGQQQNAKASWYVASQIFSSERELQKRAPDLFVAAYGLGDHEFGYSWHVPYWQKRANDHVSLCSIWSKHMDTLTQCSHLQACLKSVLDDAGATEKDDEDPESGGGCETVPMSSWDTPARERNNSGATSRGGWLPKMAQLIAAIWAKDDAKVMELTDKYYEASSVLGKEIDKIMFPKKHQQGYKGKGGKGKGGKGGKGKSVKSSDDEYS